METVHVFKHDQWPYRMATVQSLVSVDWTTHAMTPETQQYKNQGSSFYNYAMKSNAVRTKLAELAEKNIIDIPTLAEAVAKLNPDLEVFDSSHPECSSFGEETVVLPASSSCVGPSAFQMSPQLDLRS